MTKLDQLMLEKSPYNEALRGFRPRSEAFAYISTSELNVYAKLPFEIQMIQDLRSNSLFILKGEQFISGSRVDHMDSFHKRILTEDLDPILKVERILLEKMKSMDTSLSKEISLISNFRMFFGGTGLKSVSRNSFVHEVDPLGCPISVFHLIKDITGRVSHDHIRFKLNCPGQDPNKGFLKVNAISYTLRENDILELLVQGLTSAEIAEELFISVETVNRHRKNMIKKAGVSDTRKLVALYLESKVL